MKLAVIGAGAWGTALALALYRSTKLPVELLTQTKAEAEKINKQRSNNKYLPGFKLPDLLTANHVFAEVISTSELAIIATPVSGFRSSLRQLQAYAPRLPFIWACKGLEADTFLLPHQIVDEEISAASANDPLAATTVNYGILSGPSFAEEVAAGQPTAVTLAALQKDFAIHWAQRLHNQNLRIYTSNDLVGVEVGGAVKNVLAIAVGVCDGLKLGLNSRAALITRGLAEMSRFGQALGARPHTFTGLTGVGDLVLTCTGFLSRNRRVGLALAEGKDLLSITTELGHVAEGVPAAPAIMRRAKQLGVEMPIIEVVCALLDGTHTPRETVELLLSRNPKTEGE